MANLFNLLATAKEYGPLGTETINLSAPIIDTTALCGNSYEYRKVMEMIRSLHVKMILEGVKVAKQLADQRGESIDGCFTCADLFLTYQQYRNMIDLLRDKILIGVDLISVNLDNEKIIRDHWDKFVQRWYGDSLGTLVSLDEELTPKNMIKLFEKDLTDRIPDDMADALTRTEEDKRQYYHRIREILKAELLTKLDQEGEPWLLQTGEDIDIWALTKRTLRQDTALVDRLLNNGFPPIFLKLIDLDIEDSFLIERIEDQYEPMVAIKKRMKEWDKTITYLDATEDVLTFLKEQLAPVEYSKTEEKSDDDMNVSDLFSILAKIVK